MSSAESVLLLTTLTSLAVTLLFIGVDDPAEKVWALALAVMAVPYAAALIVAFGSCIKPVRRPVLAPEITPTPAYQNTDLDLAA